MEDTRDFDYISKLQLFNFNAGFSVPFADRLVEYLFDNVVSSNDEITANIERVQKILLNKKNVLRLQSLTAFGEWNEDLRKSNI